MRSDRNKKKNKFDWKIDWRIVGIALCVLVVFVGVIVFTGSPEEVVSDDPQPGVSEQPVKPAETVEPKEEAPEEFVAEEKLSEDMEPIYVDPDSPFYEKFKSADRVNVLLLGINQNMTDTIMLGSYDMKNQKVDIISIPRDTYFYRSGYEKYSPFQKINSVWNSEGKNIVPLARDISSLLCGMPIHYYMVVEYSDIRKVMDVVGGVEVNVPFHMKYDDTTRGAELHIDIPAGTQTIDSSNVIEFLRFRKTNPSYAAQGYKGYEGGDVQRIGVQQEFVKAFIKKCVKLGNILDVTKFVVELLDNKSDLDLPIMLKVATKALGFSTENMTTYVLPGEDFFNELSFWRVDEAGVKEMLETIYGVEETAEEEPAAAGSEEEAEEAVETIVPGSRIRLVTVPAGPEE